MTISLNVYCCILVRMPNQLQIILKREPVQTEHMCALFSDYLLSTPTVLGFDYVINENLFWA